MRAQKNGAVVRQFVGHERLVGLQAYRQLRELYRAVRLYVNCFQPRVLLVSKHREEEKVRRVYDPAKTPLQRLLLSGILPADRQQELSEVAQALDPLSLLHQLEQVQQAVRRCAGTTLSLLQGVSATCIQPFCLQRCLPGALPSEEKGAVSTAAPPTRQREQQHDMGVLDWRRTSRDPFEGQWERILSLVLTHPEWSGGDLFQEMQRLFPGRYRPSQQRTLQIGLRKIRASLLDIMQGPLATRSDSWTREQGGVESVGATGRAKEADASRCVCLPSRWLSAGTTASDGKTTVA